MTGSHGVGGPPANESCRVVREVRWVGVNEWEKSIRGLHGHHLRYFMFHAGTGRRRRTQ
jgi:hypothetical protein